MAEIELQFRLNKINDLFEATDYDAFDPYSPEVSGLDVLHDYITPKPVKDHYRVVVYVPDEQITPDMTGKLQQAIRRYTKRRTYGNIIEISQLRSEGARTTVISAIFSIIVLGVLVLLPDDLGAGFNTAVSTIATVILWVAIWRPTELLFFDPLPLVRSKRIWQRVADMPFELRPLSQAAPGQRFLNSE